jgi:hypothetical protein
MAWSGHLLSILASGADAYDYDVNRSDCPPPQLRRPAAKNPRPKKRTPCRPDWRLAGVALLQWRAWLRLAAITLPISTMKCHIGRPTNAAYPPIRN